MPVPRPAGRLFRPLWASREGWILWSYPATQQIELKMIRRVNLDSYLLTSDHANNTTARDARVVQELQPGTNCRQRLVRECWMAWNGWVALHERRQKKGFR